MSEADKPKDPRASSTGAFLHAPEEAELDSALAAAADLAAGLAKEVRESDPPTPRTAARDERLALDQELTELERLTHQAAEDLGAETPAPPPKKKKKRSPAAVPDFMSEFTGSPPDAAPRKAGGHASEPAADAADTVMGELLADLPLEEGEKKEPPIDPASLARSGAMGVAQGRVGTEIAGDKTAQPAGPAAGSSAALADAKDLEAPPPAPTGRAAGVVGNIENPLGKSELRGHTPEPQELPPSASEAGGLGRMLYPAAERLVGVLEVLDRPFAWLGQPVRQVIGWFAVATILTSLLVLVVAMLT